MNTMQCLRTLLGVAALVGLIVMIAPAAEAQATDGAPEDEPPAVAKQEPTDDEPPAESDDASSEADRQRFAGEVVVTAAIREERLQDVPISVTLVDGEQLTRQNVNTTEDLVKSAPTLNLANAAYQGALSIRGVGGLTFSRSSEGSVGVMIDGVSLAGISATPPDMFDVARVEVLEGPQGMLFGRNASAGLINIVTNAPNPSRFEFLGHIDVGTRSNFIGRAVVNVPLASNAALRLSGAFRLNPEIHHNLYDDKWLQQEGRNGRARFLWEASDKVTLNLVADYAENGFDGGSLFTVYSATPGSLLSDRLEECGVSLGPVNDDACVEGNNGVYYDRNVAGFSGQVDVDLGNMMFTSITGYRTTEMTNGVDLDSVPVYRLNQEVFNEFTNYSQELRLTSTTGGFADWVGGLYFFHSERESAVTQLGPALADLGLPLVFGQTKATEVGTESYAAYGQATLHATDDLHIVLGGRLGYEDLFADTVTTLAEGADLELFPNPPINESTDDEYFSYRVGVQYDFTDRHMAYATYTKGYKAPAINDQSSTDEVELVLRPEIPKAGEIGLKSTLANGRAVLNVAAYYTEVEDYQAQFFDPEILETVYANAPALTSKGVTVNLLAWPTTGLTTTVGVAYNDATYGGPFLVNDAHNRMVDAEGNQLDGSVRWKVTAGGEYFASLSRRLDGFVQLDIVYRTDLFSDAANSPELISEAATIVGGRLGVRTGDGHFGVSLYARNLFDVQRRTLAWRTPIAEFQFDNNSFSHFMGPESFQVIGLTFDVRY
jgi:iron complex outermembrane receptor protein